MHQLEKKTGAMTVHEKVGHGERWGKVEGMVRQRVGWRQGRRQTILGKNGKTDDKVGMVGWREGGG